LLQIQNIDSFYEELQVLYDVALDVNERTIVALIGSNGVGKSTLLKCITGLLKVKRGTILFQGERIDNLSPYQISDLGISMVPEGRRLFPEMTVQENLEMGAYPKRARKRFKQSIERVFDLFPVLRDRKKQMAGTLSGGEQQMLATGRALMSVPKLMVLDEPSLGLMPLLVEHIFQAVTKISEEGVTILIVEQNVSEVLKVADYYYVMEKGTITHSGLCKDFTKEEELRKAYLGL